MKLFVYEHITSGALAGQALPPSLAHEGDWMLNAIVPDLTDLAQFELIIMRDARLSILDSQAQPDYIWVDSEQAFDRLWQQSLQQHDLFLIIAPETDNQLFHLQQTVLVAGKIYLGSQIEASRLTSDKLLSYRHLSQHGIMTPQTITADTWLQSTQVENGAWIIKPRDGAGCIDTRVFEQSAAMRSYLQTLTRSEQKGLIIQPYIEGIPASLSLFISQQHVELLSVNRQYIHCDDGQLHYSHSEVVRTPFPFSLQQAEQLALAIKQILPGLWGFVGIDLVIQAEGTAQVIEINPRLTTSYVNLRAALPYNPAQWLQHYLNEQIQTVLTV